MQCLQLPLSHWEQAEVPQIQTGLISCSPKQPHLLRRSPLKEQGLPCLAVPKLSPRSLESSRQGARWGKTQPPLQSWDTETQSSPLQRRSHLLEGWVQEVWLGGITPVVKSKPHCFHQRLTCATFPGNTDCGSALDALGASLGDSWAVTWHRSAHAREKK